MIYSEGTDLGVISVNKAAVLQVINEAFKPWNGKIRMANSKIIKNGSEGFYLELSFGVQIGESLSGITTGAMNFISDTVINSFELDIDDIVFHVPYVYTQKGTQSKRSLIYRYSDGKGKK